MFKSSHRDDAIKFAKSIGCEVFPILHVDLKFASPTHLGLTARQSQSDADSASFLNHLKNRTKSAANVEYASPRPETNAVENVVVLVLLRLSEALGEIPVEHG